VFVSGNNSALFPSLSVSKLSKEGSFWRESLAPMLEEPCQKLSFKAELLFLSLSLFKRYNFFKNYT
jgi:hypothetical protein